MKLTGEQLAQLREANVRPVVGMVFTDGESPPFRVTYVKVPPESVIKDNGLPEGSLQAIGFEVDYPMRRNLALWSPVEAGASVPDPTDRATFLLLIDEAERQHEVMLNDGQPWNWPPTVGLMLDIDSARALRAWDDPNGQRERMIGALAKTLVSRPAVTR